MTDRVNHLTVILDRDYRDDDVQDLVKHIGMLRGVLKVKANVADPAEYMAMERAKSAIRDQILDHLL